MNSIDKLKLLASLPISMSDFTCLVHPATLKEIAMLSVSKYFKYVNLLTINKEEIEKIIKEAINPFDFLIFNSMYKEEFKKEVIEALQFFIKEEILLLPEVECFVIGDFKDSRLLTKDNFLEFQNILLAQNFLDHEVVKFTGENTAAKYIKSRLEKAKQEVERIKNKRIDVPIELADLIGSLSINSPVDIYKIWNISYYTFNDQFKRMRLLEQYDTGLQSIMAGADPKKVKLQDWIQSIQ